jgi:hypothetical protein
MNAHGPSLLKVHMVHRRIYFITCRIRFRVAFILVKISHNIIVICSCGLQEVNKSNFQTPKPRRESHTRDSTLTSAPYTYTWMRLEQFQRAHYGGILVNVIFQWAVRCTGGPLASEISVLCSTGEICWKPACGCPAVPTQESNISLRACMTLRQSAYSHHFVTFVNLISEYQVYSDVTVDNAILEPVTWSFYRPLHY